LRCSQRGASAGAVVGPFLLVVVVVIVVIVVVVVVVVGVDAPIVVVAVGPL
jgi:hypothetical protein